jgi:hypothetical protein
VTRPPESDDDPEHPVADKLTTATSATTKLHRLMIIVLPNEIDC